ncbi:MAG TPA: UDP-N-acetylmuramate dehydrogenase [Dermatophilaceae bacterium]|nr:UDP-N-acetylmuramate dehydrogenase [Dermatophilaceae bacterium]
MREDRDAPLAPLTTMRVGGPAARLVTVETTDELVDAVREVDDAEEPLLVLGGGSNLVIADEGFDGTVVRILTRGVELADADMCGGAIVSVAAGEPWDDLVAQSVDHGWSGLEALSGIPGATGATPIQNVGAYGADVAQTVYQVRVWDRAHQRVRTMFPADCAFSYRHSVFKATSRFVVLDVTFQLRLADRSKPVAYADLAAQLDVPLGTRVPLAEARAAVLQLRRRKGMVVEADDPDTCSCGSFFTNPVLSTDAYAALVTRAAGVLGPDAAAPPAYPGSDQGTVKTSAAWLIERAGFGRGYGMPGPAALSSRHTLSITNRGGAKAADVVALARELREGVLERFGVELVPEPVLVGVTL